MAARVGPGPGVNDKNGDGPSKGSVPANEISGRPGQRAQPRRQKVHFRAVCCQGGGQDARSPSDARYTASTAGRIHLGRAQPYSGRRPAVRFPPATVYKSSMPVETSVRIRADGNPPARRQVGPRPLSAGGASTLGVQRDPITHAEQYSTHFAASLLVKADWCVR